MIEATQTPSACVETDLRARWTSRGVSRERQDAMIAEVAAKAAPGARVGPFVVGAAGDAHPAKLQTFYRLGGYLSTTGAGVTTFTLCSETREDAMGVGGGRRSDFAVLHATDPDDGYALLLAAIGACVDANMSKPRSLKDALVVALDSLAKNREKANVRHFEALRSAFKNAYDVATEKPWLNPAQRAVLAEWPGEFDVLLQCEREVDFRDGLAASTNGVIQFLMRDLSTAQGCDASDVAEDRIRDAIADLEVAIGAVRAIPAWPEQTPMLARDGL
ncbi:hypothetical protein PSP6_690077 [Paraburkholderia tropica]|uniref:hypothetical protein n=1 Tax=Paraburkholderia tropica TaxID=92647 RepID=UPI001CB580F1|nr:hypothetical protein [Paraburkholderia tropica]CAG9235845.1 hypothetical protein PSP6_690077 [Paraburkholderia tropica]